MPTLELREVRATNPALAETMHTCLLRAGLAKAGGSSSVVLGSPRAWLGTAYHEVLEKIAEVDPCQEPLDAAVARLWDQAIAAQQRRAEAHVLNRRFGSPANWPGYYLARASVLLRASEICPGPAPMVVSTPTQAPRPACGAVMREQEFTAFGGKLRGYPDLVRDSEVVDYKSGAVFEHDVVTDTTVVKAAYVRQLRIYGYLVRQELGWWPKRGLLLPLGGAGVEVALEPAECEREASDAVDLLDIYNTKVRAGASPEEFASPSTQACRWCSFKIICPAFWQTATPDWSGQLDGAAVEGSLTAASSLIHGGAAKAISVDLKAGSEARRIAPIAPFNLSVHPAAASLSEGEVVRLVGLRGRPDGVLVPTQRTVIARQVDLPEIAVAPNVLPDGGDL